MAVDAREEHWRVEEIDPEIKRFNDAINQATSGPGDLDIVTRRALYEKARSPWAQGGPYVRHEDRRLTDSYGDVKIRLFRPGKESACAGSLIYLHGGGFTFFSLDTHDRLMREYADRAQLNVIGVDYSLSPEARFPVALEEVVLVIDWITADGAQIGLDPSRLAIGGDSAGANLALSACIKLRDRGDDQCISAMVLNYGFFDTDFSTESHRLYGGPGSVLTTQELAFFCDNYINGADEDVSPLAFPFRAQLEALPASYHVIAGRDPLADNNHAMVEKLIRTGNCVDFAVYESATHSFLEAVSISELANEALDRTCIWLRNNLAR